MKVLILYTLRSMKNNKRTTLASMMAVLIASTLLCSLCSLFYNQTAWQRTLKFMKAETGMQRWVDTLQRRAWSRLTTI